MPSPRSRTARTLFLLVIAPTLGVGCTGASPAPEEDATQTATRAGAAADPLAAYRPGPSREAAAVAALQRLFDALESGDAALLRSVMDPSVVMHFSETRDGSTTFGSSSLEALADRIDGGGLIERMWDPTVLVNGALATIWTPYDFYSGSTFSHCGVDVATLMDTPDGWKIVALSWTRLQPPACELHPDGPPV